MSGRATPRTRVAEGRLWRSRDARPHSQWPPTGRGWRCRKGWVLSQGRASPAGPRSAGHAAPRESLMSAAPLAPFRTASVMTSPARSRVDAASRRSRRSSCVAVSGSGTSDSRHPRRRASQAANPIGPFCESASSPHTTDLLDADELVPLRDPLGVGRGIGRVGNPNHAGIVREHAPFGHGARYASPTRPFPQSPPSGALKGRARLSPLRDGKPPGGDWSLSPMSGLVRHGEHGPMELGEDLSRRASELVEGARRFQSAAAQPGCHIAAPDALGSLEEALQVLSAAWYQLAADAAPGMSARRHGAGEPARSRAARHGLSREAEVRLVGALHDVASGLARSARTCRDGRLVATPIIARGMAAASGRDNHDVVAPREATEQAA